MTSPTPNPAPVPAPPAPTPTPPVPAPVPPTPGAPAPATAPPVYVPPASMAPPAPAVPAGPTYVPPVPQPAPVAEPVDDGKDWTKLPQWARDERTKLVDEAAQRRISERTALVNQHAYIASGQLGVNAAALLGSVAFADLAKQLNASASDFPAKLTEAIRATVAVNPWMAAAPAASPPGTPAAPPPASGADFSAGSGAGTPITEAQLAAMTPEQVVQAMSEGKLSHLL